VDRNYPYTATSSGGNVTYQTNAINFNPALSFSNVDRTFSIGSSMSAQTLILVNKITSTTDLSGLFGAGAGVTDKGIS
jgi:hypothetical protein